MLPNPNLISCNFPSTPSPPKTLISKIPSFHPSPHKTQISNSKLSFPTTPNFQKIHNFSVSSAFSPFRRPGFLQIYRSSFKIKNSGDPVFKQSSTSTTTVDNNNNKLGTSSNGDGGDGGGNWTTSILLFGLWAVLMYYVFMLAPNQTPSMDIYFLEKLLNLKGDDGFKMNEVLVSLWYLMGFWPLVYSMLLLPSGRSISSSKIPVWPFLVLSIFGGAYALLPYFVLWRPPSPPLEEAELGRWPFNFLESKLTAGILTAAGLGIIIYAGLANGAVWEEFYQYFRESKFIHVMSLDFTLLSTFAPFWVYNDMTARKWLDKGSWILPLALIPFLGPALYLVVRPPVSAGSISTTTTPEQ